MKRIILPEPPNPNDGLFSNNPMAYNRASYNWMQQAKSIIEQASKVNDAPLAQNFVVSTGFTLTTAIAGTSTGTDVSNFICSFINAFIAKGMVSSSQVKI